MKSILSEIKNFKRLSKLTESDDKDVKVVLIGDELTNDLSNSDFIDLNNLKDDDMTIDKLLMRLSKQDKMPEIDHVFVSIGVNDKFKNKKTIPFLIDALDYIFPNAQIDIIKGIVKNDYFYGSEEVEDFKNLENQILDYYGTFKQNGINVIGNYPSLDYGLGDADRNINMIKNQMSDSLFQNITNYGEKLEPISVDEPFIYKDNVDISGDDFTDYDTIYEFLERFEEMLKSGNHYDSRVRNSFKPDIEQLQIALKFIEPESDVEITGNYDVATEEAVYDFQEKNNINPTGIADTETIEEIFYILKVKGFDDDDLGSFINSISGIDSRIIKKSIRKFTGSVDSVWKSFTDKIIDNFEGGYWNRDSSKSSDEKCMNHPYDSIYDSSGETMFGIDRRAGGWDNNQAGREFFGLIDDEKENAGSMEEFCKTWIWNYDGGSLKEELKLRAAALMKDSYDRNSRYFSSEAQEVVESDKRLLFHFAYACWNGPGYFQNFATDINNAVSQGKEGDELVDVAIESRNNAFGGGKHASGNQKVINIIKNDSELQS